MFSKTANQNYASLQPEKTTETVDGLLLVHAV